MKYILISLLYLFPLNVFGTEIGIFSEVQDPIVEALEAQLLEDEIIKKGEKLHLKLTARHFSVNGRRQSKEVWKRYKKIYEEISGEKLQRGSYYIYRRNSKSVTSG